MKRRTWTKIHSWAGMSMSLLLVFVLLTGTLAVISQDLDWLATPAMRVAKDQQSEKIAWVNAYQNLLDRYPEHQVNQLWAPYDKHFNAQAILKREGDTPLRVYFSPKTGRLTGEGAWFNWQRFFRQTHRHLMLPVKYGVPIVGSTALLILALLVSGLVMFRGWYKGWFHWPKPGKLVCSQLEQQKQVRLQRRQSYRYWGDWHRLIGLWSIPFILLMIITGSWYLIESLGARASYPAIVQTTTTEPVKITSDSLAKILTSAKEQYPQLNISRVSMPAVAGKPLLLQGQSGALLVRARASHLAFDPIDMNLLQQRRPEQLSWYARISEAADPLHFGTFANTAVRWLWFLFGVGLTMLSLFGCYLYAAKALFNHSKPLCAFEWFEQFWRAMGGLRWPITLLCLYALVSAALFMLQLTLGV